MYFQDVILTLERYWGGHGCVLLQPHDMNMGAGTFHPATVLRSLGPRPWRCAYVQPSRRPGDARYGENPNRLGHYYQYQVLVKPSPKEAQDLYLGSLEAIGIDLRRNDIRFVEDDWESPTLGAWGLGWEVWMNGLEVTQFTYFQQVGGIACMPVPVELTYGLERLTMALQGVDDVYDLRWVEGVSYGDVFKRNEVEQSKYNFEYSDPEMLYRQFNDHFRECGRLADAGLALPAFDQCIATSHAFNLLDARGAISVAERQNYIRRIRELAVRCAETWIANTPGGDTSVDAAPPGIPNTGLEIGPGERTGARQLLVEVQCEELPASFVRPALDALARGVTALLAGVPHGAHRTYATPRRLAVVVDDVAEARTTTRKLVLGPPADKAIVDGRPTRAAEGFARGKGVDVSAIRVVDGPKGPVIAVEVTEGGERTSDLVAAGLQQIVLGLPFQKSMEWGAGGIRWGRPFHRVVAVLDGIPLVGTVAGVQVGNLTVGHRLAGEAFAVRGETDWLEGLRARHVEPDLEIRQQRIRAMLEDAASALGADPIRDDALVEEVTHLVEAPTLVLGAFDPGLLELPPRLLVESMRTHQRYFPIHRGGTLTHHFLVISNNPWGDAAHVADGNARVLRARFDDARFFLAEDKKRPLEQHGLQLENMRWIRGLGTMAAKQARVGDLAASLAARVGADPVVARRAGVLSKCDLVTQMVGEFPELQGHMGMLYAGARGEDADAARAIEEQYLPRFAEDEVAHSPAGVALALADRLDTLVGCFGIGITPKGGGDPQGLRRAALGVVRTAIERGLRLDLNPLLREVVGYVHDAVRAAPEGFEAWTKAHGSGEAPAGLDDVVGELTQFIVARYRAFAIGDGASADVVDAVIAASPADPLVLHRKVSALRALAGDAHFVSILETFKRTLNITRGQSFPYPRSTPHPAEQALSEAIGRVEAGIAEAADAMDYGRALAQMLTLRAPVAHLFECVMVDAPDPAEKAVRMGLLIRVAELFTTLADFSRISTR